MTFSKQGARSLLSPHPNRTNVPRLRKRIQELAVTAAYTVSHGQLDSLTIEVFDPQCNQRENMS